MHPHPKDPLPQNAAPRTRPFPPAPNRAVSIDMEDDEFGELYTDVLQPISFSAAPPPSSASSPRGRSDLLPRATEADSDGVDGDGFLFGASPTDPLVERRSTSDEALATDTAGAEGDGEEDWMLGRAAPAVDPPENWDDGDDQPASTEPAVADATDLSGEGLPRVLENDEEARVSDTRNGDGGIEESEGLGAQEDDEYPLSGGVVRENSGNLDLAPIIPGLSAGPASTGPFLDMDNEEVKASQSVDCDSDSDDDLHIVLNDSNHGPPGTERDNMIGIDDDNDDDGEEDLVIVTDEDQHHHLPTMEDQDWTEEAMQPTGDGERKEMADTAKMTGSTATGTRLGYNNHGFHAPHHSMYKYVRPGAAPITGDHAGGIASLSGSVRPPLGSGPISGQGRGDWRPGGRGIPSAPKSYHSNFGFPAWGSGTARGFGTGLDFTLPSHKTIFDVDILSFEEKPWRHPGVDISDFFNFGLDEDKWKAYCKRLDQLRLESTMQSKICVYESGRSEQEYDPDLPPELAAAAGHDISADNGCQKVGDGETNFTSQARGSAVMRGPLPIGRAIQVEGGGYGERFPSIDTKPPRVRDSDAIIEIVPLDSFNDPKIYGSTPEKIQKDVKRDEDKGFPGMENDNRPRASESTNPFPCGSNHCHKEETWRAPLGKEKDENLPFHSESSFERHQNSRARSPLSQDKPLAIHEGGRLPKESASRTHSNAREQSTDSTPSQNAYSNRTEDQQIQNLDSTEVNQSGKKSPTVDDGTAREHSDEGHYSKHDEKPAADSMEGDDLTSDFHISSETGGDDNLVQPSNKQKLSSLVEQTAGHNVGGDDELRASNSDNRKERSGTMKDFPRKSGNGEVIHERHMSKSGYSKRPHEEDERSLRRKDEYRLDDRQEREKGHIVSRGREEMSNSYQNPPRGRSYEKRRESESSTSSTWQRREDNTGRQTKDEDILWENSDEMLTRQKSARPIDRNQKDEDHLRKHVDTEWRAHNRDEGLRQRDRDDILMARRENKDDALLVKRKRDEEYLRGKHDKVDALLGYRDREDSGRRKKELEDGLHQKRRKLESRTRDKAEDHLSSKHRDDNWRHNRERDDRQRVKSYEVAASHRDREETRGGGRPGRVTEDRPVGGNSRSRDEPKSISYEKDYQEKERRRQSESLRIGRSREENASQNKGRGDASLNEKHSNEVRNSRHERLNAYGDRHPPADSQQMYKERQRENASKIKDVEYQQQNNQGVGKRKHDDPHQNTKAIKDSNKHESNNISSTTLPKKDRHRAHEPHGDPQQHNSMRKEGEDDPASDDENESSRKGRSKLERWTSHKERDYDAISNSQTFSGPLKDKKDGDEIIAAQTDDLVTIEVNNVAGELDGKGADGEQIVDKMDDQDRHLDTVAKLKRRSERFKLPMPKDKEVATNKKLENEVQLSNNEAVPDSDIKPERPARKRRWTGS